MKNTVIALLLLLISFPVTAKATGDDFIYILDVVKQMKEIVMLQKNQTAARQTLSRIKNAKPLLKDKHYQGHQIIQGREIRGFIGINYQQDKAEIAVFSSTPLRVRHATKVFKAYRNLLVQHYRENKHNHFDLGDNIVARLKKKAMKVTIDVYRQK